MTILNDDSSIISEQSFQIIDDTIGVIYDRRMFIIQATVSLIGLVQLINCSVKTAANVKKLFTAVRYEFS